MLKLQQCQILKAAGKRIHQLAKSRIRNLYQPRDKQELETWQYLRDEFSNATLSQAVSEVMQQHSGQVLEIAAIVDAIFVDEIPPGCEARRERVSNVLSVGVRRKNGIGVKQAATVCQKQQFRTTCQV